MLKVHGVSLLLSGPTQPRTVTDAATAGWTVRPRERRDCLRLYLNGPGAGAKIAATVGQLAADYGFPRADQLRVAIAARELSSNLIRHGNSAEFEVIATYDFIALRATNQEDSPQPQVEAETGWGLAAVRRVMDHVDVQRDASGHWQVLAHKMRA